MEINKFEFIVIGENTNKIELKKYFKQLHNTEVSKINVLKKPSKKRRKGINVGQTTPRLKNNCNCKRQ